MPIRPPERPMIMEKRMTQAACMQMTIEELLRNKVGEPLRPYEVDHVMDMVRRYARLWVEVGGGEVL